MAEKVQAFWHKLNRLQPKSGAWDLDEMSKQSLWRRQVEERKSP